MTTTSAVSQADFDHIKSVYKPCIVMLAQDGGSMKISVCDPRQKANEIVIGLNSGAYKVKNLPENVRMVDLGSSTKLHVGTCDKSGMSTVIEIYK